ncbi:hypothetical protein WR25_24687 [Diploscapter pachys]|uniref:TOG domain-containing protein n=1 Tax=Diploscapter pachys TaxID=2018661 RepID=A0A2A2L5H3_9BILA|nr:hypothetical protein WR25_24687 [Diploscapter pachys]
MIDRVFHNSFLPLQVVVAILNECKNLRSSVSRVALVTIGIVSQNMRTAMDGEIEKVCLVLMNKAGDVSSAFIREDATEALEKIVKSASAGRVLQGIILAGAKSKNNTIRASCARFVNSLVERQGSAAILNSPDILSKLLPQLVTFSKDQTPPVRQSGRQSLVYLSEDPHFDQLMRKNAASHDYKAVKEILGNIEKKGGLDALDSTSVSLSSSLSRNGSVRKIQRKLPDALQLDLDEIRADLTASGWERRIGGLKRFDEMCAHAPRAVATDTLLIEAFIGRLNDINGKVALQGMDTYLMTLPTMNKLYSSEANLKAVLNQLVLALMSHLSSKSEEHRDLAQQALSDTVKMIEPACLMPAVSAALRKANSKQKPFMLHIFTKMIAKAYNSKPKQVELTALPILWENMRNGLADPAIKKVVTDLAQVLGRNMGERNLMDQATAALDPQRRKILEAMLW